MRQILPFVIAAIAAFFMPAIVKAQPFTIQNHFHRDSCKGPGGLDFYFRTQPGTGLIMKTYFGDGTSNTKPINTSGSFEMDGHAYSSPGTYTVKHILYHNGSPVDSVIKSVFTQLCTFVRIDIFKDNNNNCLFDATAGDVNFWGHTFQVEIDSAGVKIDTLLMNGIGMAKLTVGKSYTFRLLNTPSGTTATCPSSGTISATISPTTAIEFGIKCGGTNFDLAVSSLTAFFRPVSTSYVGFSATNASCVAKNATVTLNISSKYSYSSATPTPTSVSGNTVTWNVTNLSSAQSEYFLVMLTKASSATVNVGDTVCTMASITPTSGDANTANNSIWECDSVRGSWDPNSKESIPAPGAIFPGTTLDYTINFENLGNDTAFNIHILDTLSSLVDPGSFVMLGSSHPASYTHMDGPGGRTIVRFDLADIKLADKNYPDQNKGFVRYSVRTKFSWPLGAQVENRAGIYFDINPVVMTNTTVHTQRFINVEDVQAGKQLQVYPNPTSGDFVLKADPARFNAVKVMNAMGQVVLSDDISSNETILSMRGLASGVYYILVSGAQGTAAEKIEKR